LALLLAGGALAVRVAVLTAFGHGDETGWLFTAAALILAGVALVVIALPRISPPGGAAAQPRLGTTAESREPRPAEASGRQVSAGRGTPVERRALRRLVRRPAPAAEPARPRRAPAVSSSTMS